MKMRKELLLILLIILILIPISINAEEKNNTITTNTSTIFTTAKQTTTTKKIDYFTINYVLNGGVNSSKNPTTYKKTSSTIALKNPTKKGYVFKGWYTSNKYKTKVTSIKKGSTGSKTLYAKWTPITYSIKFNGNGSTSGKMSSLTKRNYDKNYTLKNNSYKKKGYTFIGWNTKKDGTGVSIKNKANVKNLTSKNKGTVTLYAQWKKDTYTISYNLNGGTIKSVNPTKYTYTTKTITLKNPTKKGYVFKGWYTSNKYKTKITTIKKGSTGNKTLYAKWTPITYTIKFNGNGSTSGKMSILKNLKYNTKYTLKANGYTKKGDYTFVGWNTRKDGKGTYIKNKATFKNLTTKNNSTINLYAIWKLRTYTITYNLNGGVNSKTNPASFNINTNTITLKNPTRAGHTFLGWYTDPKFKTRITSINKGSTGNKILYTKWIANKYTIKFDENNGTSSTKTKVVTYNSTYGELLKPIRDGYTFLGWYTSKEDGIKIESTTKVNILKNQTLYARWEPSKYTISFDTDGGTEVVPTKEITYGETYGELPKTYKNGYTFLGWYFRSLLIDSETKVTTNVSHKLIAKWNVNKYIVTFDENYIGGSISTKEVAYDSKYGVLPTPIREGYKFLGWYTSLGERISTGTWFKDYCEENLYAKWEPSKYTISFNTNGGTEVVSTKEVSYGETYGELPTVERLGYTFAGWYLGDELIESSTIVTITTTTTIEARWIANQYILTFDANGGEEILTTKDIIYDSVYGELPIPTREGYEFVGWYTEKENGIKVESTSVVNISQNKTLYAQWRIINVLKNSLLLPEQYKDFWIDEIIFENVKRVPTYVDSWDVAETGDIKAYLVSSTKNPDKNSLCKIYIISDGSMYANENMSYWFADLIKLSTITNISLLNTVNTRDMSYMFYNLANLSSLKLDGAFDTSNVTNMSHMFYRTYIYDKKEFILELGEKFDTSNVVDMSYMFAYAGYNSSRFTLDLGENFDTSSVTDMSGMFLSAGEYSNYKFEFDLGEKFDTSSVTDMSAMFSGFGASYSKFKLNLRENFDTGNVTDMSSMFYGIGRSNTDFELDLGEKFDTSNVTDMSGMFSKVGYNNDNLVINLGEKFDTSNVVNMSGMFLDTGYKSKSLTLDLGENFDTSKVTNMSQMFDCLGYSSDVFALVLGEKFDTSNVTNMRAMFHKLGYNSKSLTLDLGDNFNPIKVNDMSYMFAYVGYNSEIFTLDLGDNFNTKNTTNMSYMFSKTGYNSKKFILDLGDNFDTSNVTDMSHMFENMAYNSESFNLDLKNKFNTGKVTDMTDMFGNLAYNCNDFTINLGDNFNTKNVLDMTGMFAYMGHNSKVFTLDLGDKFDTSNVLNMLSMFEGTNLITTITIRNPDAYYNGIFKMAATHPDALITVNYTGFTNRYINEIILNKSDNSNVIVGILVN